MSKEVQAIVNDIKKKNLKPIYFLMGEEPYFIDLISDCIETSVLPEDQKSFNQQVLYGRDVSIDQIVSSAKRFPMMADHQVVIVKEAQDLSRTIDKLVDYAKNPQPSTVLVFCYKNKKLDKRKALYKSLKGKAVIFESKPLYDNQVPVWINTYLKEKQYTISPKAAQMLVEFLGTSLQKVSNELDKLCLISKPGSKITPELIEKNIGISKDYNNFELRKAIGERDTLKAHRIVNYFGQNPKDNPMVVTVSLLYSLFSQLLTYHSLSDKSKGNVASKLKINPFFVSDYTIAARNYPMKKVSRCIAYCRETDMKGKGVGANATPQSDLLKELVYKIMN